MTQPDSERGVRRKAIQLALKRGMDVAVSALGLLLGIGLTVLVQSSSITTSLIVPLLGAGVINLHQVFPYMMGANIGTTVTAFLEQNHLAMAIRL